MKKIAIDFDGTLFDPNEEGTLEPKAGAREALQRLRELGHKIIIHTCRVGLAWKSGNMDEEVKFIETTLRVHGIEYDEIFMGEKLVADLYVDDRAISYNGDWTQTQKEIEIVLS